MTWGGLPRYSPGHHPSHIENEIRTLREAGFVLISDVQRELGIGATSVRRLAKKLFGDVLRRGKRRMRVFTCEQLEKMRVVVLTRRGCG